MNSASTCRHPHPTEVEDVALKALGRIAEVDASFTKAKELE